jgi:hypothetical protein
MHAKAYSNSACHQLLLRYICVCDSHVLEETVGVSVTLAKYLLLVGIQPVHFVFKWITSIMLLNSLLIVLVSEDVSLSKNIKSLKV